MVSVIVRTIDGAVAHRLPGLSGEIAFWVLLSLPALLLSAVAIAGLFGDAGGTDWQAQMLERIGEVAGLVLTQPTVDGVLIPLIEQLISGAGFGLASIAFLTAVWTASRAIKVVMTTIAIVYGGEGQRAGWKTRILGFVSTLGALVVGTVLAPLLIAGPNFGAMLESWVDIDLGFLPRLWEIAYWPTVVALAVLALTTLYHIAVPVKSKWRFDLPGAFLATLVWLAGSGGLRLYGWWLTESGTTAYGSLAGPIVALLWLWLTGFAVLLGGELNAHIAHARSTTDTPTEAANLELGTADTRLKPESDIVARTTRTNPARPSTTDPPSGRTRKPGPETTTSRDTE